MRSYAIKTTMQNKQMKYFCYYSFMGSYETKFVTSLKEAIYYVKKDLDDVETHLIKNFDKLEVYRYDLIEV